MINFSSELIRKTYSIKLGEARKANFRFIFYTQHESELGADLFALVNFSSRY